MDYSWDWKSTASQLMTKKEIAQHSNYHVFQIMREGERTVLRAKQYMFSSTWVPEGGLKLLKDRAESEMPISDVAEFRVDHLNLEQVSRDLQKYYMTMDLAKRMVVQSSYDRLRKKLESLPVVQDTFEKMNLGDLRQQVHCEVTIPENFVHLTEDDELIPELQGARYSEDIQDSIFASEFVPGLEVVIYTTTKKDRPWIGRVVERVEDNSFMIQWFKRKSKTKTYLKSDLPLDKIDDASVILWGFTANRSESSFEVEAFYQKRIKILYDEHDSFVK